MARKSGPFSADEIAFIRANANTLSIKEISDKLDRNPNTVSNYIAQIDGFGSKADILNLKKRYDWKLLQKQLSPEELETFEWHWNNIVKQFKDEIYHTEGMQVVSAIKHEILANRMMTDQRKITMQVEALEDKLRVAYDENPIDAHVINGIEKQMAMLCQTQEANNREYRENSKKLAEILEALKSTRRDRITKVEDMKRNFPLWMKRLQEDPLMKKELGEYMEKMRLAMYEEVQRLGKPFKYANGEVDRPILSADTLEIEGDVGDL